MDDSCFLDFVVFTMGVKKSINPRSSISTDTEWFKKEDVR